MSIDETSRYVDKTAADRAEALKQSDKTPSRKEGKSTFDELLEQSRMLQQSIVSNKQSPQTATQQAVREADNRKERQKEESKDREKEQDDKQAPLEKKRAESQDDMAGKRVVGKQSAREQGGNEGGGHGDSKGDSRHSSQKGLHKLRTGPETRAASQGVHGKFAAELAKTQTGVPQPQKLPQEILDKLVRYVRVGLNREGDKEVQLDLHENVFRGLRLLLSRKNGKVRVHFVTADGASRALFSRNAAAIRESLSAKGIAVESIRVT